MRSLRTRLGVLMAIGAFVVTGAATIAVAFERWQEENNSLLEGVELAAFQLSEAPASARLSSALSGGVDPFVVVFDSEAAVLQQEGEVSPDLIEDLIDDVWFDLSEQDVGISLEYETDPILVVAGATCLDGRDCDSVVVGAHEQRLPPYLGNRWYWLLGPALAVALAAWAASRWLVGRSLRPVDDMRRELEAITDTDLDRRVSAPATGDELESLGLTLNEVIARLGAAVTANQRFVADAAHELRSPITGVRAALEVDASRRPGSMVADSVEELDRAARLIDDLLLLARQQGEPHRFVDVDLDELLRQELAALRTKHPQFEVEQAIEPVRILGDADALGRLLKNLLENAARYGGRRITATLRRQADLAVLAVEDDGPGVPTESRDLIFERFARLDSSRARETGGSGLGLAIVHDIAAAHSGSISVCESDLGGAKFELTIPTR